MEIYLYNLRNKEYFNRNQLFEEMNRCGLQVSASNFKAVLQKLLDGGDIVRVGRNAYCVAGIEIKKYSHSYSDVASDVAKVIENNFPYLVFSIFELTQLNVFVNHQIAHNVIFLSVEGDLGDFVFDKLKEQYPGKVLINPSVNIYSQYWTEDMIVIEKLVTEAPMGTEIKWHTRIEKMLVDLFCDPIQKEAYSVSELKTILEDAFAQFAVDESCMFRYAKRRGASDNLKNYINKNTNIRLRVG
ncbi:MAG: hypothetical protein Q4G60_06770 [bacterium]|nr:hypothetical protein [bacterium]